MLFFFIKTDNWHQSCLKATPFLNDAGTRSQSLASFECVEMYMSM